LERAVGFSRLVWRLGTSVGFALVAIACASPPPPSPTGPTGAERVARQEGYLDGRKAEAQKAEQERRARDAEIAVLKADLAEFVRAEASHGQAANAVLECQETLNAEQQKSSALQKMLDQRALAEEVARARALGAAGRKRELADCYAETMLCENLLSIFLEAASSEQERRTLANLGTQVNVRSPGASPTKTERASEPEPQPCCKVCSKGYACGNSCISRASSVINLRAARAMGSSERSPEPSRWRRASSVGVPPAIAGFRRRKGSSRTGLSPSGTEVAASGTRSTASGTQVGPSGTSTLSLCCECFAAPRCDQSCHGSPRNTAERSPAARDGAGIPILLWGTSFQPDRTVEGAFG
jgi:hypothetical protein